ncbi:hypothetical protein IJT93_02095 [bacterium]|nr:hypothetical protein [bacterium]
MLKPQEQGRFAALLRYVRKHPRAIYTLTMGEESVQACYDTCYESDNCLEETDENYEEFYSILFRKADDGSLFEITYHNLSSKVTENGKEVI